MQARSATRATASFSSPTPGSGTSTTTCSTPPMRVEASRLAGPSPDGMSLAASRSVTIRRRRRNGSDGDPATSASTCRASTSTTGAAGGAMSSRRARLARSASRRVATRRSRASSVHVDDGEAKLTVKAMGGGPVRSSAWPRAGPAGSCTTRSGRTRDGVTGSVRTLRTGRTSSAPRSGARRLPYGTTSDTVEARPRRLREGVAGLIEAARSAGGASILVVARRSRAGQGRALVTKSVILDLVAIQKRWRWRTGGRSGTRSTRWGRGLDGALVSKAPARRRRPHASTPLGAEVLGDMLGDALIGPTSGGRRRPPAASAGDRSQRGSPSRCAARSSAGAHARRHSSYARIRSPRRRRTRRSRA